MKTADVRSTFLNYFNQHNHEIVPSSRLIPDNDPTILFTNAGMNQFKNAFLGHEKRSIPRATSSQKCVRAGGKHNDLENVGHTARHHTFFEMLGNFSFGDYFKKEAIHYSWDLVTNVFGLPKDKLYVSVFKDDQEAADIWNKQEGVPKDRIYRFGEKDNFWRMGNSGPCGPCSEIFYDLGENVGGDPKENVMGGDGDRFVEFWNLVFMQFNESEDGTKTPLPNPSIDTGMGLERMTTILQGEINNYHTTDFQELIQVAVEISNKPYSKTLNSLEGKKLKEQMNWNIALRVLADHARSVTFLICDGVMPSNEGRGYVLRRILRRAIRFSQQLSDLSLLEPVALKVIENMSGVYPELNEKKSLILSTIRDEESRFLTTLKQGTSLLNEALDKLKTHGQKTLPGETVFKLYDTYGFPVDLTKLIAHEVGVAIDENEFNIQMAHAKQKAKASWKGNQFPTDQAHLLQLSHNILNENGKTQFVGYDGVLKSHGEILILSDGSKIVDQLNNGEQGYLISNSTCFYAESGGQVGDLGNCIGPKGQCEVLDTLKLNDIHIHQIIVTDGILKNKDTLEFQVASRERNSTACNHSATHLLHSALIKVLGDHVHQAGSLVDSQKLRFDFTHNKSVSKEELLQIENLVNFEISRGVPVVTKIMSPEQAKEDGAMALFGEKYGDQVRVVTMGQFSKELCGGTHVQNTAMIRAFIIVSESSVSSGVRRIEALTGDVALKFLNKHAQESITVRQLTGTNENWMKFLETHDSQPLVQWVEKQNQTIKDLNREITQLKGSQINIDELIQSSVTFAINGQTSHLILSHLPVDDRELLSQISDKIKDKVKSAIIALVGKGEKSHPILVMVTKDLQSKYSAGQLLKNLASELGGKGGGRPDFAQGAGSHLNNLESAFNNMIQTVTN